MAGCIEINFRDTVSSRKRLPARVFLNHKKKEGVKMYLSKALLYLSTILILTIIIVGCSQPTNNELDRINSLEDRINILQEQVTQLSNDTKSAILSSTEKGYDSVRTKNGYFFVSIDKIEPYLDGFKVYVNIGNPTLATFSDLKLTVQWSNDILALANIKIGTNELSNEAENQINKQEYTFTDTLLPGKWTKVDFVIPNVKAEDIKFIQVMIETGSVALQK
ncbi:DUF3251 domain-containing protein [Thermoanaerobacteraceae bacterium SP2]|nr:DUF3251 domain-containing protein [Thermoanaerobacteraceae bacterium SP2]